MNETKRCPFCGEEILSIAIKCRYCGTMLSDAPPPSGSIGGITLVRQALASRYEIQEEIGRGGMATVYRAVQKNLNRPVALKVIHQNLVHDSEFVARFHREAQVCASMQHPNIVTVYDEGELGGVHFMAMELLDGHDLHRLVRQQGKLSVEQTLSWIKPIVQALEYAHSRGIIHRDIKSSNILVSNNGRPVLMDFGIAHAASGTRLTQTGLVIGTPEYMSPEQAEGRQLDHRTDIYSLGIVLYECLTGKVPFKGDSPLSIIMKVVNEAPGEPIQLNRQIPGWLNSVVLKCLAKEREQRFVNAAALYESLTATQLVSVPENKAVEAPPSEQETVLNKGLDKPDEGLPKPPSRKKKSGSGLKVFAWVLFAALLVAGVVWAYQYHEEQQIPERERLSYYSALNDNTINAYKKHLASYPIGRYAHSANKKIEELKDDQAWQSARNANIIASYNRYLSEHPNGQYANEARTKKGQLEAEQTRVKQEKEEQNAWQTALNANTINSYNRYLREYPNGRYAIQARNKIRSIEAASRRGTFTDRRDGQTYKWVRIGNQDWMAENLNYRTASGSWCYENKAENCSKYGRLYTWETARNACPPGWHLPSDAEWTRLENHAGGPTVAGRKLKATRGWGQYGNGADDYGFSALPGGYRWSGGSFLNLGTDGYWWSSTERSSTSAWYRDMYLGGNVGRSNYVKTYGFSLRCVRD